MKKYIIITAILLGSITLSQAQSIKRSVIGSAGQTFTNGGHILRTTVGEAITLTLANGGYKITQGFQQGIIPNIPLPITGLDFMVQRINALQVKLKWKSATEINNKGFAIERKKENESNYLRLGFVNSKAEQGNSDTPLEYEFHDDNNYIGASYYRLRQEDIDGKYIYSIVRVVKGETNKTLTMKVWPIPAHEYVNIMVDGIAKSETIDILDFSAKIIKSYTVNNQSEQRIELSGLATGVYFIRLKNDTSLLQKIVVQ